MIFFVSKIKNLCEQMLSVKHFQIYVTRTGFQPTFYHLISIILSALWAFFFKFKREGMFIGKISIFRLWTSLFLISYFFQLTLRIPSVPNCENTD